jgi:hypothetical protein
MDMWLYRCAQKTGQGQTSGGLPILMNEVMALVEKPLVLGELGLSRDLAPGLCSTCWKSTHVSLVDMHTVHRSSEDHGHSHAQAHGHTVFDECFQRLWNDRPSQPLACSCGPPAAHDTTHEHADDDSGPMMVVMSQGNSSSWYASILAIYSALKYTGLVREVQDVIAAPFSCDLSQLPIKRAFQTLLLDKVRSNQHVAALFKNMLRLATKLIPELFIPDRIAVIAAHHSLQAWASVAIPPHEVAAYFDRISTGLVPAEELDMHILPRLTARQLNAVATNLILPRLLGEPNTSVVGLFTHLHGLHPMPLALELVCINWLFGRAQGPLRIVASYKLLVQEPYLLLRLPLAFLCNPNIMQLAFFITRSLSTAGASLVKDTLVVKRRQHDAFQAAKVTFKSLTEMSHHIHGELYSDIQDVMAARMLIELWKEYVLSGAGGICGPMDRSLPSLSPSSSPPTTLTKICIVPDVLTDGRRLRSTICDFLAYLSHANPRLIRHLLHFGIDKEAMELLRHVPGADTTLGQLIFEKLSQPSSSPQDHLDTLRHVTRYLQVKCRVNGELIGRIAAAVPQFLLVGCAELSVFHFAYYQEGIDDSYVQIFRSLMSSFPPIAVQWWRTLNDAISTTKPEFAAYKSVTQDSCYGLKHMKQVLEAAFPEASEGHSCLIKNVMTSFSTSSSSSSSPSALLSESLSVGALQSAAAASLTFASLVEKVSSKPLTSLSTMTPAIEKQTRKYERHKAPVDDGQIAAGESGGNPTKRLKK